MDEGSVHSELVTALTRAIDEGAADRRLRGILDNVVSFVGTLSPEGELTEANAAALNAANLSRDEVIGLPFWDCYWWTHDEQVRQRVRNAVTNAARGQVINYDEQIRYSDGEIGTIAFQIAPRRRADGSIDLLVASGVDVTERKAAERALRSSHDTFQHVVESSPFGIFAVDADFRLSMVSDGAQKIFRNVGPLVGRDFAEVLRGIWSKDYAREAIERFRNCLKTGAPYIAPAVVLKSVGAGENAVYDWRLQRITMPDGRHGVVCNFYDLSEIRRYEAALRESEERFRATFQNAAVGIAHVGTDGSWLRVNDKLCRIVGYSSAEIKELTFQEITHPDDLEADLHLVGQVLAGARDEYCMDKRYIRKDGSTIWVRLTVGCVRNPRGEVSYFISVVEDITAQKVADEHRALLVNELNHRVKNSLATIQSMASQTIRSSRDMLDFRSKFTGRLQAIAAAHDSIFDVGRGMADVGELIRKQLQLYADPERLSIDGTDLRLSARAANALALVVHEMATNAVKYGALSNEKGRIDITWSLGDGPGRPVVINWREHGGPAVEPPGECGFGSRLLEATIVHALDGDVAMDFNAEGLHAVLSLPTQE